MAYWIVYIISAFGGTLVLMKVIQYFVKKSNTGLNPEQERVLMSEDKIKVNTDFENRERNVLLNEIRKLTKECNDLMADNELLRIKLLNTDKRLQLIEREGKTREWADENKIETFAERISKINARTKSDK